MDPTHKITTKLGAAALAAFGYAPEKSSVVPVPKLVRQTNGTLRTQIENVHEDLAAVLKWRSKGKKPPSPLGVCVYGGVMKCSA